MWHNAIQFHPCCLKMMISSFQHTHTHTHTHTFPMCLSSKELAYNSGGVRNVSSIPGYERAPGVGNGNPLQYSHLENHMDRGAWWPTVHGVATRVGLNWSSLLCTHTCIYIYIYIYIYMFMHLPLYGYYFHTLAIVNNGLCIFPQGDSDFIPLY